VFAREVEAVAGDDDLGTRIMPEDKKAAKATATATATVIDFRCRRGTLITRRMFSPRRTSSSWWHIASTCQAGTKSPSLPGCSVAKTRQRNAMNSVR
jgi:hypothetical protein